MIFTDYHVEATRAILEQKLCEAHHARLVKQVGRGWVTQLIGLVTTLGVVH